MRKFKMNKLIRDHVPDMHFIKGHILDDEAYINELKKKLVEEAIEVLETKNQKEFEEELGDIFEVIEALLKATKTPLAVIKKYQNEKRAYKGGFERRFFAEYVEFPETEMEWIKDALGKPEKYPEIID